MAAAVDVEPPCDAAELVASMLAWVLTDPLRLPLPPALFGSVVKGLMVVVVDGTADPSARCSVDL